MQNLSQMINDPQQQQQLMDFANRYRQGDPTQGYSNEEATQRFQQIAPRLPAQEFQASAAQAFGSWNPQQRQQFGQYLQQQAQQQNVQLPQQQTSGYGDPSALAQLVTQAHQQQPGGLMQLLGGTGGSGSVLSNPLAKAALAGIAAMAAQRMFSQR